MRQVKKWLDNYAGRLFIILLAVVLLCYACLWAIESGFGRTKYDRHTWNLTELTQIIEENNIAYGKEVDISFDASPIANITIMTMRPANASEENPVPLIVACHGSNNTLVNFIRSGAEMARRGYGVLLFDGQGHGESSLSLAEPTHNTAGYEAALEYGMSLPWVDEHNVGITGHSWGARQVNATVNHINSNTDNHIKAALYCGSGQGLGIDPQASDIFLGAIAPKYDEFLNDMLGSESYDFSTQRNARVQADWIWPDFSEDEVDSQWLASRGGQAPLDFGDDAYVETNTWYTTDGPVTFGSSDTEIAPGSVVFFSPNCTHGASIYNSESISYFIQYWQETLGLPNGVAAITPSNQITYFSQYIGLVGFIALFLMLFPLAVLLLKVDFFKVLRKENGMQELALASFKSVGGQIQFWATNIITLIFSLGSFYWLCYGDTGGSPYFPGNEIWPATYSNHFLLWMMAQGIFAILFYCLINGIQEWRAKKAGQEPAGILTVLLKGSSLNDVFRSVLYAGILMTAFWGLIRIGYDVFGTVFNFSSFLGEQIPTYVYPFPFIRLLILPRYLPFFAIAWIPMTFGLVSSRYRDIPEWVQSLISGFFNILPLVIINIYYGQQYFLAGRPFGIFYYPHVLHSGSVKIYSTQI